MHFNHISPHLLTHSRNISLPWVPDHSKWKCPNGGSMDFEVWEFRTNASNSKGLAVWPSKICCAWGNRSCNVDTYGYLWVWQRDQYGGDLHVWSTFVGYYSHVNFNEGWSCLRWSVNVWNLSRPCVHIIKMWSINHSYNRGGLFVVGVNMGDFKMGHDQVSNGRNYCLKQLFSFMFVYLTWQ